MIAPGVSTVIVMTVLAQAGWSASGGVERFSLRDISRNGPPADASPVTWTGDGPSLSLVHERTALRRVHRMAIDFASAGSFAYNGPILRVAAPAGDRASRLEGRYEYRRYFLRDRVVRGLDAGLGVQGSGRRLALTRHLTPAEQRVSSASGAVAGVAVARFHRYSRWSAEAAWTNGLALTRERNTYSTDARSDAPLWGGGWLTDLSFSGAARVSTRAWLTASWLQTGEGSAVSHHSYAFARRRVVVGVTYDR